MEAAVSRRGCQQLQKLHGDGLRFGKIQGDLLADQIAAVLICIVDRKIPEVPLQAVILELQIIEGDRHGGLTAQQGAVRLEDQRLGIGQF